MEACFIASLYRENPSHGISFFFFFAVVSQVFVMVSHVSVLLSGMLAGRGFVYGKRTGVLGTNRKR